MDEGWVGKETEGMERWKKRRKEEKSVHRLLYPSTTDGIARWR